MVAWEKRVRVDVHTHHEWLADMETRIREDYARARRDAKNDPQRLGHEAESVWAQVLEDWLPANYRVGKRKYILPEIGDECGEASETDLVVFTPGYPERLHDRATVPAGAVAAAFSVKATITPDAIREAAQMAANLKSGVKLRRPTVRDELLGPFPVGLLAVSHGWKEPSSEPRRNLKANLASNDRAFVDHPRLSLDYVCVADLAAVTTLRFAYVPSDVRNPSAAPRTDLGGWKTLTNMTMSDAERSPGPFAVLVAALTTRLAQADPSLLPMAEAYRLTNTMGDGQGEFRDFTPSEVYSPEVLRSIQSRPSLDDDGDWAGGYS